MTIERKIHFDNAKRIVVKVGSNVLTEDYGLNLNVVRSISRQICRLIDRGLEVILVSSGAMSAGMRKIGLSRRPDEIPKRQAVSAVGQAGLIMEYENAFERYGNKVAQILLTGDNLSNRKMYLNARNTLYTLLSWQVVPIINENDTVSVEELKFGDNDILSVHMARLVEADALFILTSVDGLYPPGGRREAIISRVEDVDAVLAFAEEDQGRFSMGGMSAKLQAIREAVNAGTGVYMLHGRHPERIALLLEGKAEGIGTYFVPKG